ncbi:glycosyltransferase family 4 protein [Nakamurella flava]|uniref:Glycosyltransferase family 4 protein n=1 Tax=Nakamurella flava TaxID=2576308 RepID=A0A4U6QFW1_9ACTN|nr:glycosyltransferase family 1 protein [Nakamurella flava]TKV58906.1 glycosyltransferase family 4 protein [Nakamurella flava]
MIGSLSVALDGTPLYGQRTGIGRYTENLLTALGERDDLRVSATAFTTRGWRELRAMVPPGVRARSLPAPARLLHRVWTRTEHPTVGWFAGRNDVFHGTNFVLPPTGRRTAGVVTVHDLAYLLLAETVDAHSRRLVDLVPRSLRRAAVVCTPTRAIADQVAEHYPGLARQVVVTPHGVTPEWLAATAPAAEQRSALGLPDDHFLFVGTREPRKGLDTLIAAYGLARSRDADLPDLVLVGPAGWGDIPGLQDGPPPGVRIRPYAEQAELKSLVAGARAVVMPSRYEGFGLPALEAMATGTAAIVSTDPALLEVTGGLAATFPVGDAEALAERLTESAAAPSGAAEQAERDRRRRWAAAWTWQASAEATVRAYRLAAG